MDVHPIKNGMYRYWSIAMLWFKHDQNGCGRQKKIDSPDYEHDHFERQPRTGRHGQARCVFLKHVRHPMALSHRRRHQAIDWKSLGCFPMDPWSFPWQKKRGAKTPKKMWAKHNYVSFPPWLWVKTLVLCPKIVGIYGCSSPLGENHRKIIGCNPSPSPRKPLISALLYQLQGRTVHMRSRHLQHGQAAGFCHGISSLYPRYMVYLSINGILQFFLHQDIRTLHENPPWT